MVVLHLRQIQFDPPAKSRRLLEYLGQRTNMRTATNRKSRWLFPGRRAGEPLQPRRPSI